jgi:hypothetical protein
MDTIASGRMERVAVITDIHANVPALDAVLRAIEWIDVDAVYCARGGGVGLACRVRGEAGNGGVKGRTR